MSVKSDKNENLKCQINEVILNVEKSVYRNFSKLTINRYWGADGLIFLR